MRSYLMEFIGTFFLVLGIGLSGNPAAIGLTLMVMIYAGGHISGAHYNPAVTLAVWMRGKCETKDVPGYLLGQVLGATAAAIVYYIFNEPKTFAPAPGAGVSISHALLAEVIWTFALAFVVLNVATSEKTAGNYIYGLAIGMTVTAGALTVGPISGGCFNPAVYIGPALIHTRNSHTLLTYLPLYIIGPCLGGILAALTFKFMER